MSDQEKQELSWEAVALVLQRRQEAIDNGLDPDEIDEGDGPKWEDVQAFLLAQQKLNPQKTKDEVEKSGEGVLDSVKKFFDFGGNSVSKEDWPEEEARRRDIVESLLPGGNVKPLYESPVCLLCEKDPLPRDGYAVTDMGHPDPPGKKSSAIGIRVKTKVGSMVPIQIACCPRCKKNYRIASYLSLVVTIVTIVLAIGILAIPGVNRALLNANEALPLILFVISIPLGFLLGRLFSNAFIKKKSAETKFNIAEIPFVARMEAMGWFPLYDSKSEVSRLVFSKERIKGDWFND